MTTINNIADLVRIIREQPEWADTIRSILLSQELLELPERFAKFVQRVDQKFDAIDQRFDGLTQEVNGLTQWVDGLTQRFDALTQQVNDLTQRFDALIQQVNDLTQRVDGLIQEMNARFNWLEGQVGNLNGYVYEQRVRNGALVRAKNVLGLEDPQLALTRDTGRTVELDRLVNRALSSGAISPEQEEELQETDIIIAGAGNRHAAIEVSVTADNSDIQRASLRAGILANVTGGEVTPVIITANLNEPQRLFAENQGVTIFTMRN